MRILIYAINGVGLGHLNRLSCVAKAIKRVHTRAQILFVTNSDFVGFFYKHKFKFVKVLKDFDNNLFSAEDFAYAVPKNANLKILSGIVDGFKPEIAIFDTHFPEEFLLECSKRGIKNYLILRDNDKGHIDRFAHPRVLPLFEKVFIASQKSEVGSQKSEVGSLKSEVGSQKSEVGSQKSEVGSLKSEVGSQKSEVGSQKSEVGSQRSEVKSAKPQTLEGFEKIKFVGSITRREPFNSNLKFKRFTVLITSGGGGYQQETERFLKAAIRACKRVTDIEIITISGPLFNNKNFMPGVTIKKFEPDLTSLMQKVDFVITQAGYNTCNEIVTYKVPSLVLPVYRETDNQEKRAYDLANKGLCLTIIKWDEERIFRIINRIKKNPQVIKELKNSLNKYILKDGAETIAKSIKVIEETIKLKDKDLTEAITLVKNKKRLILIKGNFLWTDILLLIEYLKEAGVIDIHLVLNKPIPDSMLQKVIKNKIVFYFEIFNNFSDLLPSIQALKDENEAVVGLTKGNPVIIDKLISLRVYIIQIIGGRESEKLTMLVNKRLTSENFLFDISLREKPIHVSYNYLAEKEKIFLINIIKGIKSDLLKILKKAGILRKINLLKSRIEEAAISFPEDPQICSLELQKYELLSKARIYSEVMELKKKISYLQKDYDFKYNSQVNPLEIERGWLYHERHNLFQNAKLSSLPTQEGKELVGQKLSELWEKLSTIDKAIELLVIKREKELGKITAYKSMFQKEKEIIGLQHAQDALWNKFQKIEVSINDKKLELQTELSNIPDHDKLIKLQTKLKVVENEFAKEVEIRFDPLRLLAAKTKDRKIQEKKDKVWAKYLVPLEKKRDLLSLKVNELLQNKQIKKINKLYDKKIFLLEKRLKGISLELDKTKEKINTSKTELEEFKENKQLKSTLKKFSSLISNLNRGEILEEIEMSKKQSLKIQNNMVTQMKRAGILEKYSELTNEIEKLSNKITLVNSKIKDNYLELLKQSLAHLLVSKNISKELIALDNQISVLYNKNKTGNRLLELKNKFNLILKESELFDHYYACQEKIKEIENKMSRLN